MTRKDYRTLAAALQAARPIGLSEFGRMQVAQWKCDVESIAQALLRERQEFNYERFLAAAGVQS